jgi:hypothetical protein
MLFTKPDIERLMHQCDIHHFIKCTDETPGDINTQWNVC